jgi:hypothetical protein
MSEDREPEATSNTAELEIKWEHFGNFVKYGEHKLEIKVENKVCDVNKPGIYKLISQDESELYVGQGQSIHNRLSNYKNARYELLKLREGTNRRIQGWMLRLIKDEKGPIEIFVCTLAYIRCGDEIKELDLHKEYNRLLIENLEISITPNDFELQNFAENWARNKESKSTETK